MSEKIQKNNNKFYLYFQYAQSLAVMSVIGYVIGLGQWKICNNCNFVCKSMFNVNYSVQISCMNVIFSH